MSFLLVVVAAPRAGRAQPDAVVAPPPGLARLYFYRLASPFLLALDPQVVVNGKAVGRLARGQVFFRDAAPGRYRVLLAGDADEAVELTLAAGEVHFLKAAPQLSITNTRVTLASVSAMVAKQDLATLGVTFSAAMGTSVGVR